MEKDLATFWPLDELNNVGHVVSIAAQHAPDQIAVAAPKSKRGRRPIHYDTITFSRLELKSNQIAASIQKLGIRPGTRLALMVPPGIDFTAFVFGLFKAGVVVILIDPGMGRKNMVQCLSDAEPEGIVGVPLAQFMRFLFRNRFPKAKQNIVVASHCWPGCHSSKSFSSFDASSFEPPEISREDHAAIIFTTGSTGPPKGVLYRHRMFLEQARQIRDYFRIQPGTVDVSGFPLFALFNCAMGTTTVFPRMDATRPADVDPLDIKDAVERFEATQSFGSPALWNTVSRFACQNHIKFPTIKTVLSAGAPVPPHVLKRVRSIIAEDGEIFTPYGATESLPVACNSGSEVLNETAAQTDSGKGTCVGKKFTDIDWRVIAISDQPIESIDQVSEIGTSQIGELIVSGDVVSDQYVTRIEANPEHKIKDGERIWHRMGDVGYMDEMGRFWFCGRKGHRVVTKDQTLFPVMVEGIVNTHPKVYRSALVGIGQRGYQMPVVVIELWPENWTTDSNTQKKIISEVLELCSQNELTVSIENVLVRKQLPVDIRHNSKIFREQLTDWARDRC